MKSLRSYVYRVAAWTGVMDKHAALRRAAKNGHAETVRVLKDWMARGEQKAR
jgi:hypothetical protein